MITINHTGLSVSSHVLASGQCLTAYGAMLENIFVKVKEIDEHLEEFFVNKMKPQREV